jgi:hypothetical protein
MKISGILLLMLIGCLRGFAQIEFAPISAECLEGGSNLHHIDVSSIKRGVYVVRLISASGRYSEEVIIKE